MDGFDSQIQRLGTLALNHDTAEEFMDLYKRLLEDTYTEMHRVANTDKLFAGEYRARAEMLKGLLEAQLAFFGAKWPAPRVDA